jgi:hypothetical protein
MLSECRQRFYSRPKMRRINVRLRRSVGTACLQGNAWKKLAANTIKIHCKETGFEGVDWARLVQQGDQRRTHVSVARNVWAP